MTKIEELSTSALEDLLSQRRAEDAAAREKSRQTYEALRDETINTLVPMAIVLSSQIKDFKEKVFADLRALYDLLIEHSKRHANGRGNFQIISLDSAYKIDFKRQDLGYFDERSKQAEAHIVSFVNRRFADDEDARDVIMTLLERRKGSLDVKKVQTLYAMEDRFNDEEWLQGLRLLRESWTTNKTCYYATFYVKDADGHWRHINLDFASV